MRFPHRHLFAVGFVALALATLASFEGCNETAEGGSSCDALCSGVGDCDGASCMAVCVAAEAACTDKGRADAFESFVTSQPGLVCTEGAGYSLSALSEIALIPCDVKVGSSSATASPRADGGGVIIGTKDSGAPGKGDDSGPVIVSGEDAGFDAGTCVTNGCPLGYTCAGVGGEDACIPDEDTPDAGAGEDDAGCTSDGTCSSECIDNCGTRCSFGQCTSGGCVSTGCDSCNASGGACSTLGTCLDNCGNQCCAF